MPVKKDLSKFLVKNNSHKVKRETQYRDMAKRKVRRLLEDLENGKIAAVVCKQKITAIESGMNAEEFIDSATTEDKEKLIRLFIAEAHLGVDKKIEKLVFNIPSEFHVKENNVLQAEAYLRKGGRMLWRNFQEQGSRLLYRGRQKEKFKNY